MRKIDTIADLRAEKKRLQFHRLFLEAELKKDVAGLKESLAPLAMVTSGAKQMLSSKDNSLVSTSVGSLVNFLTRHVLLRNSGLITRLLVPYIAKNATSNLVENNKSKIVDWVGSLISKLSNRHLVKDGIAS
ncbi:MAG: hypothetical protein ACXVP0_05550 [Bacteroidia bacterium]